MRVTAVEVSTPAAPANVIETFWQKNVVDLSRGMDFNPRGSVLAKFTHLNHKDFQMKISVRNAMLLQYFGFNARFNFIQVENQGQARQALVRLFLAPKFDERGQLWSFVDQRNLFVEIDKFIFNRKLTF